MYTKPHVSTFEGGMNTDVSHHKMAPSMYADAQNIRIITDEGLSSGAIVNEYGNEFLFQLPDTVWPTYYYAIQGRNTVTYIIGSITVHNVPDISVQKAYDYLLDDLNTNHAGWESTFNLQLNRKEITVHYIIDTSPPTVEGIQMLTRGAQQDNLKIISLGIAGDYIIVFSTNVSNDMLAPVNTYGQIWKLKFNKVGGVVEQGYVDGNNKLTLDKSLVVNRVLNYSTANKIHFETYIKNEEVIKIYMYDGYNILRHINIVDPNSGGLASSAMDILADVKFSYPIPLEIIESGSLRSGQYRYAYQLYNIDGSQTVYSPTSIGLNMYPGDYYNNNDMDVIGGPIEESSSKSIRLTIRDIDRSYQRIRIVSIFYPNFTGTPEITNIKETSVPESGSLTFIDDGTTVFGAVTIGEFRTLGTELFVPVTAEVKDNMLICANKTEQRFELGDDIWDARTYRFPSGVGTTTVIDSISGISATVDSASSDLTNWDVPLKHDCIQDYENQLKADKYYQIDSVTPGGEGPNIKYEFIVGPEMILQDEIIRGQTQKVAGGAKAIKEDYGSPKQVKFQSVSAGNPTILFNSQDYINFSYSNYASPIIAGLFKGYAKNEMYRFAIELFNKKGQKCFSKWIADIRFPDFGDLIAKGWEEIGTTNKFELTTLGTAYELVNCSHTPPDHTNKYKNPGDPGYGMPIAEDDTPTLDPNNPDDPFAAKFNQVKARALGIKFTVKSLPVDEDGNPYSYRIVRAPRPDIDKRMVMQGPLMGIQEPSGKDPYHRPLTLNMFGRATRIIHIPHITDNPSVQTGQSYRFGNYAGLLGYSPHETITDSDSEDIFNKGDQVKWITQRYEHMFIAPEIYFIDNYVVPPDMDFEPIGMAHIQEKDVVDSYRVENVFWWDDGDDWSSHGNYIMQTGAPQFYWGPTHLNNIIGNTIKLADAVVVPSPPPDFNLGTAVYNIATNTVDHAVVYRNVVLTEQPGEPGSPKESIRAARRLIVSLDDYFPGWKEDDDGVPDSNNRDQRLVDSHLNNPSNALNYQILTSYLIGRLKRSLPNQYGGNSYFDRTQTTYMPASPIVHGDVMEADVFEGDIYINVFDYLNLQFSYRDEAGAGVMETQWFILESTINVDMHSAISYNDTVDIGTPAGDDTNTKAKDWRGNYNIQEQGGGVYGIPNVLGGQYIQNYNLTTFNTSYISDNRATISIPTPLNYDSNVNFYARIHRSLDKVYDDIYDRWLTFLPDNWKDVNTAYGQITNLIEYSNKLYFFQERALGIIGINEMALEQTDQAGATLLLGKADVMDQYVYIDSNHGITIPNSVYSVPRGIIGFDSEQLKIIMVGAQGITELSTNLGIQSFVKRNSLYENSDFHGVYDSYNNRAYNIITSIGQKEISPVILPKTIVPLGTLPDDREIKLINISYNTAINVFESTYDFTPKNLIVYKGLLMTTNPDDNSVWIHGVEPYCTFYGTRHDWYIKPIINKDAFYNHMLTNFEINMDNIIAPYQLRVEVFPSVPGLYATTTFKRKLNTWRCMAPRAIGDKSRLRGHTFKATLTGQHIDRTVTHSVLSYSMPNIQ